MNTNRMSNYKPHINISVAGPYHSGKSTLFGHFIYQLGGVDKRTIERFKSISESMGLSKCEYAFIPESQQTERSQQRSIVPSTWVINTNKFRVSYTDTPGQNRLIKNCIRGIQKGDYGLLVLSALQNLDEQKDAIREKLILFKTFLVDVFAVVITKMSEVDYSESRFDEVQAFVTDVLSLLNFDVHKIKFIPVDGFEGENLSTLSLKMPWAVKKSKPLLEEIDALQVPERSLNDKKPLRVTVEDSYRISGIGCVCVGMVESGILQEQSKLIVSPSGVSAQCRSIEMHHESLFEGKGRDFVGVNLLYATHLDFHVGDIISDINSPAVRCERFEAQIQVVDQRSIKVGYMPLFNGALVQMQCKIVEMKAVEKKDTKEVESGSVTEVHCGESAVVSIIPLRPLCIETFEKFPKLGTFLLRDNGKVVATGRVKEIINWSTTSNNTIKKLIGKNTQIQAITIDKSIY
ncbi:elongation factor 1-alpha, putative [Entamoeba invadens IP1]|uniref:Elongation factor 1-alpha, putative n=1 Tax=Entamoeba invadens IP1 TaxID=370355 RepID=A0A0A1TWU7_ENTIV|nr:elongation factor 1-alpha, putative [Entamoeba invadens IP1]ELP85750.1 elongation factor 1-alpha, putative [Entamoeba invadens IP1]|eukprot:XP_004185096.1 elongation factor 1-alpha, putative [Entamoeba invadens IP1]